MIFIDNISKLLPDAVCPEVATMVITILNRIRYNTGCSILVIGHTTKGNPKCAIQPNDYFGSSMIQNFFSELFYLDKTKDDNFFLCNVKSKDKESYETTVPVLSRGDHSRLGVGFSFCYLSSLADIQLPFSLEQPKVPRNRNLSEFKDGVDLLLSHGWSQRRCADFVGVQHTSISRLYKS